MVTNLPVYEEPILATIIQTRLKVTQEDLAMTKQCRDCGQQIDQERVEALPRVTQCVGCALARPTFVKLDPNEICAKASATGRNGFAPSD